MVAIQDATPAPVPGVRLDAAGPLAATATPTAPAMRGQTNVKLTPGSFHVTRMAKTAHTTSAPTCAAAAVAHRRASAHDPSETVTASSAIAAAYTPRNAGAPPHAIASCMRAIVLPASIASPPPIAAETNVATAPSR